MNWLALILAFSIAVLTGGFLAKTLDRSRESWTARRRLLVAVSALPCFILLATVAGVVFVIASGPGDGENMQALAVAATAAVGIIFALVTLIGGLVGARLAQTGKPS